MMDIAQMLKALPEGYERACYETKAIIRKRGVTSPGDLMMLAMFHLINGCSLIEVSEIARLTKLGQMSDVAFMKRFEQCGDWFKWIAKQLKTDGMVNYEKPLYLAPYTVLGVDASDVMEKGRSARTWRLHYALNIFEMSSESYKLTKQKVGESLLNFDFKPHQLVVTDRMYSTIPGMKHCLEQGADFILRMKANSFTLYDESGQKVDILNLLTGLKAGDYADLPLYAGNASGERVSVRVCATHKTPEAIADTAKRLHQREIKQQHECTARTKSINGYIITVTSLPADITAEQVLETYRVRWQIEIQFKRMKSILDLGEIPKRRSDSVKAWLNGKLMIALLIERVIASVFSPEENFTSRQELMAGSEMDEADFDHEYS